MAEDYELAHACIRVMDLEESVEFYEQALNFEETKRRDFPEHEFTLVFMEGPAGNFEIELTYNYDPEEPYELGNGFSHFAVMVDDIEKSYESHQEQGYELSDIYSLSEEAEGGYYFISDPDGYEIEVIQR